jgi:MerR family copper efflux transcriptional regulator
MSSFTIGKLARSSGIGIETVRYYERTGMIAPAARRASGYREYTSDDVRRIRFIKRAQLLGFTLKEIKELLSLSHDPEADRKDVRAKAQAKIADIDAKVQDLLAMKQKLRDLAEECHGKGPASGCPIILALVGNDEDLEPPHSTKKGNEP